MILLSILIKGWRCYVDPVQVGPFSEGLNVLYAPNATGKSTLFEALLRGLLDSHKVTGREVEALRPWGRSLAPTIVIEFCHGGTDYRITKRFLDGPISELERKESGRYVRLAEGDSSDEKVREILTHNPPGRGLVRPENLGLAQILWAPQEKLAFTDLSGDLVSDIHTSLGVQVSGPETGSLEERIDEAYFKIYTPNGKLKGGKDAPRIVWFQNNLKTAQDNLRESVRQQQEMEEAARKVEDLRVKRDQARRISESLTRELKETRSKAEAYKLMQSEKEQKLERVKSSEAQYNELNQKHEAIKTAKKNLSDSKRELQRIQDDVPLLLREVEDRDKETAVSKKTLEDARKDRKKIEEAEKIAEAARQFHELKDKASKLEKQLEKISQLQKILVKRKKEMSVFVAPDSKTLRAIRKLIKDRDEVRVRLEAALITLEIVPEKKGIMEVIEGEKVGRQTLIPGSPKEVKGLQEIVVHFPEIGRLRVRGPSGSIEEFQNKLDETDRKIQDLVQGFGTSDLEDLEALEEKATELHEKVIETETKIETLLSDRRVEDIERDHTTLLSSLEEIYKKYPSWRETQPNLGDLLFLAEEKKNKFIELVEKAESDWESVNAALVSAREKKISLLAKNEELENKIRTLDLEITDLTGDGKTDENRKLELGKLALSFHAAKEAFAEIDRKLTNLGEDPGNIVSKLEKQLSSADETATKALEEEKIQEGRLEHLSAQGTYSNLAVAEEEVSKLKKEIAQEKIRIESIQLLRNTIKQCQSEALSELTKPVELKATRTLQRIAGGRLGRLHLGECFEPAHVFPELAGTNVSVESVSGGEREQIYFATRLALADVLTKDERQLVVLDDVLTATDTGRLARILNILEETAQRLQVLVLTCHPERYQGLEGATFIDLEAILREKHNN